MKVDVYFISDKKEKIKSVVLNNDGRPDEVLIEPTKAGNYELVFHVEQYFKKIVELQNPNFLNEVSQVIKKDKQKGGVLEFGTEVVVSEDGTVAALLGASPGASTATSAMLDLIGKCFSKEMQSDEWKSKLKEMVPSYDLSLSENEEQLKASRQRTSDVLELK